MITMNFTVNEAHFVYRACRILDTRLTILIDRLRSINSEPDTIAAIIQMQLQNKDLLTKISEQLKSTCGDDLIDLIDTSLEINYGTIFQYIIK